jgi:hypothetical protein
MRPIILVLTLLAMATPAFAQQLAEFSASAGRCPNPTELENINARGEGGSGRYLGYTFVLRDAVDVRENASPIAPMISPRVRPSVFERVSVLSQANIGTPNHSLLVGWRHQGLRPTQCGWLRHTDLVGVPQQLRIDPSNPDHLRHGPRPLTVGNLTTGRENRSRVLARAVLNNSDVEGNTIYTFVDPSRARSQPGDADPSVFTRLRAHEIYSIFATARGVPRQPLTVGAAPRAGAASEGRYFLIGRYPGQTGQSQLFGWVHFNDLYIWSTRTAVYWAPAGGAQVFGNLGGDGRVEGIPFFTSERQPNQTEDGSVHRLPVIDSHPDSVTVQQLADRLPRNLRDNPLQLSSLVAAYQVAMIYQSCSPNRECVSAAVEDARTSQRARVLRELGNVDIVFLIDRSRSMGPYFVSTAEAIRLFVRDRLATQTIAGEASVRIGVMAYSDYTSGTPSWEGGALDYLEVVPMHDPGGGGSEGLLQQLAAFRTQEQQQDRNDDFLEAPFAALIRTAREARWRPDARQRIIIHLADHGNREAGLASPERPNGIRERYSVADVVAALGPQEQGRPGINYIPIMVEGQPDGNNRHAIAARAAFAAQSREIARQRSGAVTSEDALTRTTPSTSRTNETPQQRRDAVLAALVTAQERHASVLNHLRDMQACARMPNTPECQNLQRQVRSNNIPLIRANNQILIENGFTEEEIARDQNRVQTVRAVWVPPVQQAGGQRWEVLTYWVALDQQSFRDIREAMGGLCRLFAFREGRGGGGGDVRSTIMSALNQVAAAQITDPDGVSPTETIGTLLSIPFWERQQILSLPIQHFVDERAAAAGQGERAAAARERLLLYRRSTCTSFGLLSEVENGRRLRVPVQNLSLDPDLGIRFDPRQWEDYSWDARTGESEQIYYIPYEYFPMNDPPAVR